MATRWADDREPGGRWRIGAGPPPVTVKLECAGGGGTREAALVDVSTFGCRLRGDDVEGAGDHLRLDFGRGSAVTATVVWRRDGMVGCRFDRPIATRLMRELICGSD